MPIAKTGPMAGTHFRAGSPEMAEYIRANGGLAPGMWEPDEQDYADSAAANNASGIDPGATGQGYSDQEAAYRASPTYQARDAQRQADLAAGKTPQGIDWDNQYTPMDAGNALAQAQRAGGPDFWDQFLKEQAGASGLQMPGFNTGFQDQDRLQQQRVIQELQAQAAGDPNSQAQQQLQQGYQSAQGQQSSLGSTMRGQSAGAARQGIAAGQQGIQRGYVGDQQMLSQYQVDGGV